jgi:hypothetical protein
MVQHSRIHPKIYRETPFWQPSSDGCPPTPDTTPPHSATTSPTCMPLPQHRTLIDENTQLALLGAGVGVAATFAVQHKTAQLERETLRHMARGRVNALSVAVFREFLAACKEVERIGQRRETDDAPDDEHISTRTSAMWLSWEEVALFCDPSVQPPSLEFRGVSPRWRPASSPTSPTRSPTMGSPPPGVWHRSPGCRCRRKPPAQGNPAGRRLAGTDSLSDTACRDPHRGSRCSSPKCSARISNPMSTDQVDALPTPIRSTHRSAHAPSIRCNNRVTTYRYK